MSREIVFAREKRFMTDLRGDALYCHLIERVDAAIRLLRAARQHVDEVEQYDRDHGLHNRPTGQPFPPQGVEPHPSA